MIKKIMPILISSLAFGAMKEVISNFCLTKTSEKMPMINNTFTRGQNRKQRRGKK
jgi:hypothetical protein